MPRLKLLLGLVVTTAVWFSTNSEPVLAAECVYCSCDGGWSDGVAYGWTSEEINRCHDQCFLSETCEAPISCEIQNIFVGLTPPETLDKMFRSWLPNLTCYSIHTFFGTPSGPTWAYNSVFASLRQGDHMWLWNDIDRYFGNNDGQLIQDELHEYLVFMGYFPSADCEHETGENKVAVYGRSLDTLRATHEITHIALETYESMPASQTWFESKLGASYRLLHLLEDITGPPPAYGEVLGCYSLKE